jgi:hypothetical protein
VGQVLVQLPASKDAYISAWNPDSNYGGGVLRVRNDDIKQSLLYFDLSSLPANIVLDEAVLQLWVISRTNANSLNAELYALRRAWDEHQVTHKQASAESAWQRPGAHGDSDRDPRRSDSQRLPASGPVRWTLTELARKWRENPGGNKGIIVGGATVNGNVAYSFASREDATVVRRPVLLVRYRQTTPTSPTATPTASPTPTTTPTPSATPIHLWLPLVRR